jgi:hypothetical protein
MPDAHRRSSALARTDGMGREEREHRSLRTDPWESAKVAERLPPTIASVDGVGLQRSTLEATGHQRSHECRSLRQGLRAESGWMG